MSTVPTADDRRIESLPVPETPNTPATSSTESSPSGPPPAGGEHGRDVDHGEGRGAGSLDDLLAGFDDAKRSQQPQSASYGVVSPFARPTDQSGR